MITKYYPDYEAFCNRPESERHFNGVDFPVFDDVDTDCAGCWNCTRCFDCIDCIECEGCLECHECINCDGCFECYECELCNDCRFCEGHIDSTNEDGIEHHQNEDF